MARTTGVKVLAWCLALAVIGAFVLANALATPDHPAPLFLSFPNLRTVVTQTVVVGLCTLGMTFVIVSGGIDLSVGSNVALSSIVAALVLRTGTGGGMSSTLALLAAVTCGGLVGLLNGTLVTQLKIVPFIVTLGTLGIARGLGKQLSHQEPVRIEPDVVRGFAKLMQKVPDAEWQLVAPGVWLLIALAIVMALLLRRSVLGTWTVALGSSEPTARLCGVPVARTRIVLYAIGGLLAGLAGAMQLARLTVGDPTTATGLELDVIAAVVIGGGSLAGGEGSILGSLLGALLMALLKNGCNLAGVENDVQEMLVGAIIVSAVALDRLRSARSR